MSIIDKTTAYISTAADTSGAKRVKRALDDVEDKSNELIASMAGLSSSSQTTAASITELGGASTTAAGGMSSLQAQIYATHAASETLEGDIDSLNDALKEIEKRDGRILGDKDAGFMPAPEEITDTVLDDKHLKEQEEMVRAAADSIDEIDNRMTRLAEQTAEMSEQEILDVPFASQRLLDLEADSSSPLDSVISDHKEYRAVVEELTNVDTRFDALSDLQQEANDVPVEDFIRLRDTLDDIDERTAESFFKGGGLLTFDVQDTIPADTRHEDFDERSFDLPSYILSSVFDYGESGIKKMGNVENIQDALEESDRPEDFLEQDLQTAKGQLRTVDATSPIKNVGSNNEALFSQKGIFDREDLVPDGDQSTDNLGEYLRQQLRKQINYDGEDLTVRELFGADFDKIEAGIGRDGTPADIDFRKHALDEFAMVGEDEIKPDRVRSSIMDASPPLPEHTRIDDFLADFKEEDVNSSVQNLVEVMQDNKRVFAELQNASSVEELPDAIRNLDRQGYSRLLRFLQDNEFSLRRSLFDPDDIAEYINVPRSADDLRQMVRRDDNDVDLSRLSEFEQDILFESMANISGATEDASEAADEASESFDNLDADISDVGETVEDADIDSQSFVDPGTGFSESDYDNQLYGEPSDGDSDPENEPDVSSFQREMSNAGEAVEEASESIDQATPDEDSDLSSVVPDLRDVYTNFSEVADDPLNNKPELDYHEVASVTDNIVEAFGDGDATNLSEKKLRFGDYFEEIFSEEFADNDALNQGLRNAVGEQLNDRLENDMFRGGDGFRYKNQLNNSASEMMDEALPETEEAAEAVEDVDVVEDIGSDLGDFEDRVDDDLDDGSSPFDSLQGKLSDLAEQRIEKDDNAATAYGGTSLSELTGSDVIDRERLKGSNISRPGPNVTIIRDALESLGDNPADSVEDLGEASNDLDLDDVVSHLRKRDNDVKGYIVDYLEDGVESAEEALDADKKDLQEIYGIGEVYSERIVESLKDFDSDVDRGQGTLPDGGEVVDSLRGINQSEGQAIRGSREGIGLSLIDQLYRTDVDKEPNRVNALQNVIQEVFRPDSGFQTTIFNTKEGREEFAQTLQNNLPDNALGDVNTIEGRKQIGAAVANIFDRDDVDPLKFMSGEGDQDLGNKLQTRLDDRLGAGEQVNTQDILRVVERKALPRMMQQVAARNAPSLFPAVAESDDVEFADLLPDSRQVGIDPQDARDQGGSFEDMINESFDQFFTSQMRGIQNAQQARRGAPGLLGGFITGPLADATNQREEPLGIFGSLNKQMQSRGDRGALGGLFDFLTGTKGGASVDQTERLTKRVTGLKDSWRNMLPVLQATSANIGSFNVNISSTAVLVTKLTAILGPLISALGGVAAGAVGAAGAFGSFIGVGAIEYLGAMEDHMAGISDKQEAIKELSDVLGDMAFEALTPLRSARIGGDGASAMQLFVRTIRNGLRLLNDFARVAAHLVELDVVGEEMREITELIFNNDLGYAEAFEELLNETLPLLSRMIQGVVAGLPGFIEFIAPIAGTLGKRFLDFLSESGPLLAIITNYGAGFFDVVLQGITALAAFVKGLSKAVETLTFGIVELEDFATVLGQFAGGVFLASKLAGGLSSVTYTLTAAFNALTASSIGLSVALRLVAINILIILGAVMLLEDAVGRLQKAFNLDNDLSNWERLKAIFAGLAESAVALGAAGLSLGLSVPKLLTGLKNFRKKLFSTFRRIERFAITGRTGQLLSGLRGQVNLGINLGRITQLGGITARITRLGQAIARIIPFAARLGSLGRIATGPIGYIVGELAWFAATGNLPTLQLLKDTMLWIANMNWIWDPVKSFFMWLDNWARRVESWMGKFADDESAAPYAYSGGNSPNRSEFVGGSGSSSQTTNSGSNSSSAGSDNGVHRSNAMVYNDVTVNSESQDEREILRIVDRMLKRNNRDITNGSK